VGAAARISSASCDAAIEALTRVALAASIKKKEQALLEEKANGFQV
jgi:hypothetical protein